MKDRKGIADIIFQDLRQQHGYTTLRLRLKLTKGSTAERLAL
jgi:hypothetical protein